MSDAGVIVGKQEGQVLREVQRHSNLSKELEEIVGKTEARLSNLLIEPPKPEPPSEATKSEQLVVMATQISDDNDRVQGCINHLGSILDRLEI